MKVISVVPRGYCQGVVRAIRMTKETLLSHVEKPVYMLGMIVHNAYVVHELEKMGIICLDRPGVSRFDLLDEIDSGTVIFTAHGVSDRVMRKALDKGLHVIDATCPDVEKTHVLIKEHCKNGDVIYIGKHHHPEAEGVVENSSRIHLVANSEDIKKLPELHNILITNQTTLSHLDVEKLIGEILERFPDAAVAPEICDATAVRQKAILELNHADVLIVVGDPHSNNSNQLKKIGEKAGIKKAYLVENHTQLTRDMFSDRDTVAVTSGSSTPTFLTTQVIRFLNDYAASGVWPEQKLTIDSIL